MIKQKKSKHPYLKGGVELNERPNVFVKGIPQEIIKPTKIEFFNLDSQPKTEYKIVIPKNVGALSATYKGALELAFFLKDATGVDFPIVADQNLKLGDKYISLGDTTLFKQSNLLNNEFYNKQTLGNDGYIIKTFTNTVIINGVGENAKIYGAYGFLERNMGFKYYYVDEWTIEKTKIKYLNDFYVIDFPDFKSRYLDVLNVYRDNDYIIRMRQHGSQCQNLGRLTEGGGWVGGDESMCMEFLPYSLYGNAHKDWYSPNSTGAWNDTQLCLATVLENKPHKIDGLKPLDLLWKSIQTVLEKNDAIRVVMLGINDNNHPCECEKCKEFTKIIGDSGLMCIFMNTLITYKNAWQKSLSDTNPNKNRQIKLAFFAYQHNINPPATYDSKQDKFEVIKYTYTYPNGKGTIKDTALVLDEDIILRIAPSSSGNLSAHFNKTNNPVSYNSFYGWRSIAKTLAVWEYGTSFKDYLAPYMDFTTIQENFRFYRDINVQEILTQLPAHTEGTSFHALKTYLRSQLMWNASQNAEFLVKDFMLNYYGIGAGEVLWEYLTFLRLYAQSTATNFTDKKGKVYKGFDNGSGKNVFTDGNYYQLYTKSDEYVYYPPSTIKFFYAFFIKAINELKKHRNKLSGKDYEKFYNRIQIESLYFRYLKLTYLLEENIAESIKNLKDFEYYAKLANFTQFNHRGKNGIMQVEDFISQTKQKLKTIKTVKNKKLKKPLKSNFEFRFNGEFKTLYKVGDRLYIPNYKITLNGITKRLTTRCFLQTSNLALKLVSIQNNHFIYEFVNEGAYAITLFATDKKGGYYKREFAITVTK